MPGHLISFFLFCNLTDSRDFPGYPPRAFFVRGMYEFDTTEEN
jgi:hypothetical protein